MLRALAHFLSKKSFAWATIAVTLVVAAASIAMAARIQQDDDVLAFLPHDNPDVAAFYDVNRRFGGLDIALVGIATDDVFAPEFLADLKRVTKELNETEGVDYAMSLGNVEDFAPDPEKGGIGIDYLVRTPPKDDAERVALRERVMSRDHVVGSLVSDDGKAVLLYCFLAPGSEPKLLAGRIRTIVERGLPDRKKYWGGAPFISSYIYGVTQDDLRRLTPWACAVKVLLTLLAFRDLFGMALVLTSTVLGIGMAMGVMGALDVHTNLVLGSMPVILFALGSAHSIHLMTRYYVLARDRDGETALKEAITGTGPTMIATGLATAAGLASFAWMDIQPLRTFGVFTAVGIISALLVSLTFVPAVIRLAGLRGKEHLAGSAKSPTLALCGFAQRRRTAVGIAVGAVALAGLGLVTRVDSRMDNAAFFQQGSPPDLAEAFLRDRFGGAQFLQVHVAGDMTDPAVLRELRSLSDEIALLPSVTSVTHVGDVVAQMNDAMEGDERVPDTAAKVKLLYGFLAGKKAVGQLVSDDRRHALLQVKVRTTTAAELEALLGRVEAMVAARPRELAVLERTGARGAEVEARAERLVLARIEALAHRFGVAFDERARREVERRVKQSSGAAQAETERALLAYVKSDEMTAELPESPPDADKRLAGALARLGPRFSHEALSAAVAEALERPASDEVVLDVAAALRGPAPEIAKREQARAAARELSAAAFAVPEGPKGERFVKAVGNAWLDRDVPNVAVAAVAGEKEARAFEANVTGLPVLHRGLSQSVVANQLKSMLMAMALVFVILSALYRSIWSGLLALAPVLLALVLVYAAMPVFGIHLDIGTSMLASLIIGSGVDYAVHFLASWKAPGDGGLDKAAEAAAGHAGPAIWINALMVSGGLAVLTLGEARPLKNFGGLTAAAMLAAASATFVVLPILARRRFYRMDDTPLPSNAAAQPALDPASPSPPEVL